MDKKIIRSSTPSMGRSDLWYRTPEGESRGFIQAHGLEEVWFHTGTACNLACPFCLESSKPGDNRLQLARFDDVQPFIDEAVSLGVRQFSFTGGEPFINKDIVRILDAALQYRPCLVLTNATEPLIKRLYQLEPLLKRPHPLHFRVSLDHFDAMQHDQGRGQGMFARALEGMRRLYQKGFSLSIASHVIPGMDANEVAKRFSEILEAAGLPADLPRIEFPEFHPPAANITVPQITMHCMTTYQTEKTRQQFMCAFSRMIVKINGRMQVYACTLVDDDPDYALAETLAESLQVPVSMKHHRCYSCFRFGASCSELKLSE
ncbi:radical SAM protein [Nitrosomonas communis]|uniref:radical SAM protein n=1 Tax=Nitrosomonas communis TaxID=44574 RepID=UPI003D2A13F4